MNEKQDININAPHGTIIIIGDNQEPKVARQIETLIKERDILLAQLKSKDDLIQKMDVRLKELENK